MKFLKITREDSFVYVKLEAKGTLVTANNPSDPAAPNAYQSTEGREITAYEAPLKSFDKALQALADVVVKVLEVDKEWKEGLRIRGITLSHTKLGTRSIVIAFQKDLDATDGQSHRMALPFIQIDQSVGNEHGRPQIGKAHVTLVVKFLEEAEKYVLGHRQQMSLPLETPKKADTSPTLL